MRAVLAAKEQQLMTLTFASETQQLTISQLSARLRDLTALLGSRNLPCEHRLLGHLREACGALTPVDKRLIVDTS